MLFPDAQVMNLDEVVDRAMTETGMLYDILGGPSPNANQPPRPLSSSTAACFATA
ncbi:MAG: hypothetical protein IPK17_38825 [Chloroflexi bacterium]|uniref:hypothetical protein n=1 Tax=Candidatus Flexifilum breve TaxID=3140694 RepID=UPI003135F8D1|nr:hypothetical protein [Chloroflexota bacterium]